MPKWEAAFAQYGQGILLFDKVDGEPEFSLDWVYNPDILATLPTELDFQISIVITVATKDSLTKRIIARRRILPRDTNRQLLTDLELRMSQTGVKRLELVKKKTKE